MTSKNTRFVLLIGAAPVLSGCELEPPAKELVRPVRAMKVGDVVELASTPEGTAVERYLALEVDAGKAEDVLTTP